MKVKDYQNVKKYIDKRNDQLTAAQSREPAFGYLRNVPTKHREKVHLQNYYEKTTKETSEETKKGEAAVTKTIEGKKWFKDEMEMKKIYFDSTEEILEGLVTYEKIADALHMDSKTKWDKFPSVIDVSADPAFKELLEKRKQSKGSAYDADGKDWDEFKEDMIHALIEEPYP